AEVPIPSVGYTLQKSRSASPSRFFGRRQRSFVHRLHIVAIDSFALKAVGRSTLRQALDSDTFFQTYRHCILIVLANINHRQLPDACEFHRFMDTSLINRAIAKKAYSVSRGAANLRRQCPPRRRRYGPADRSCITQKAETHVTHVHFTAATFRVT